MWRLDRAPPGDGLRPCCRLVSLELPNQCFCTLVCLWNVPSLGAAVPECLIPVTWTACWVTCFIARLITNIKSSSVSCTRYFRQFGRYCDRLWAGQHRNWGSILIETNSSFSLYQTSGSILKPTQPHIQGIPDLLCPE
jgi:hypothetical protein